MSRGDNLVLFASGTFPRQSTVSSSVVVRLQGRLAIDATRAMDWEELLPDGVVEAEPTGGEHEEGKPVLVKLVWAPLTSTLRVHVFFGRGMGWEAGTWRRMVELCIRSKYPDLTVPISCYL